MKVVILAGGLGTRISELTKIIPKPMIKIFGKPIIHRIVDHFYSYGFKEFYIALGYKGEIIQKYFQNCKLKKGIKINCIKTGKKTMTGGRIKRLKKYLKSDFLLTYGDGLSNVNLKKLLDFHQRKKKLVTVTAVRPPARFGTIKIIRDKVKYFKEKNNLDEGWINGGFFIMSPKFLSFIKNDQTYLEKEPFEKITKKNQFVAFKHKGFWQCMDTLRDKEILEKKIRNKEHLEKK
jgi:glucose-1-phosphate cytidylyltransferase